MHIQATLVPWLHALSIMQLLVQLGVHAHCTCKTIMNTYNLHLCLLLCTIQKGSTTMRHALPDAQGTAVLA